MQIYVGVDKQMEPKLVVLLTYSENWKHLMLCSKGFDVATPKASLSLSSLKEIIGIYIFLLFFLGFLSEDPKCTFYIYSSWAFLSKFDNAVGTIIVIKNYSFYVQIDAIRGNNSGVSVSLEDICLKPVGSACASQTVLQVCFDSARKFTYIQKTLRYNCFYVCISVFQNESWTFWRLWRCFSCPILFWGTQLFLATLFS